MRLYVLYDDNLHTCTEETLCKQYTAISKLVHQLNRTLPHLHQRQKFVEVLAVNDEPEKLRLRQAARKAWPQIRQLYDATHGLAELLSYTRYRVWHFVGDQIRDHGTLVTMPSEIEQHMNLKFAEMLSGTKQIFATCRYLLELCGLDVVWEHNKIPALRGIIYPGYTEADRPMRLRSARRGVVADIREDCHEQIALAKEIFEIARDYLEYDEP